jgi:hypothetical protein
MTTNNLKKFMDKEYKISEPCTDEEARLINLHDKGLV